MISGPKLAGLMTVDMAKVFRLCHILEGQSGDRVLEKTLEIAAQHRPSQKTETLALALGFFTFRLSFMMVSEM